jgi:hypothetical protein
MDVGKGRLVELGDLFRNHALPADAGSMVHDRGVRLAGVWADCQSTRWSLPSRPR